MNGFENIPPEIRERPQWVVWRYELVDDEPTKVPHSVVRRGRASSTDPATWGTFEDAIAAANDDEYDGPGFVFSEGDPFTGRRYRPSIRLSRTTTSTK